MLGSYRNNNSESFVMEIVVRGIIIQITKEILFELRI
jgi:hypothetical protein